MSRRKQGAPQRPVIHIENSPNCRVFIGTDEPKSPGTPWDWIVGVVKWIMRLFGRSK